MLPASQAELEAEIRLLDTALEQTDTALRTLLSAENPSAGIYYAQDIHALRQEKLILRTRQELRRVRVRQMAAWLR